MSILQLAATAVLFAMLAYSLRALSSKMTGLLSLLSGLFLLGAALMRYGEPISFLLSLGDFREFEDSLSVILRMLGIGMLCTLTADTCRDLGEEGIASRVELCAKAEILLLSLPFLEELFSIFTEVTG